MDTPRSSPESGRRKVMAVTRPSTNQRDVERHGEQRRPGVGCRRRRRVDVATARNSARSNATCIMSAESMRSTSSTMSDSGEIRGNSLRISSTFICASGMRNSPRASFKCRGEA